jgi:hypothetical protein
VQVGSAETHICAGRASPVAPSARLTESDRVYFAPPLIAIVADRVAGYVADHLRDLDVARVARIEFSDLASATEFRARLSGGVPGFLAAMHKTFVSGGTATGCNFVAIRRCDAASELGAQVFAAAPGDAVGPLRSGASSYAVGCLLQVDLARDGEATRAAAEQILFDQWLAQRRNEATTTWHWGTHP